MASKLGDKDALTVDTRDSECSTITSESPEGGESECSSELTEINRPEDAVLELGNLMKSISLSKTRADWSSLPPDVDALILARCDFYDLYSNRLVCKSFRDVMKRATFRQERGRLFSTECSLSPLVLYVTNGKWHMLGYEYKEQKWRKLPPLEDPIPIPDMDLFKDFLVTSHGGLFCVNVGKTTEPENILVFNPSTRSTTEIPRMGFSRHPVVLHLHVTLTKSDDTVSSRYWIVAVGSSATGTEELSRKTEVYDSVKKKWEAAGYVPGTDFSVNEHQSGVYCESENVLLETGFMFNGSKGLLAYDLGTRKWREDWLCPFPQSAETTHFAITQLVQCSGEIYLFSEQEMGRAVTHCIDRLDLITGGGFSWTRKVKRQRQAYRSLLVYPEYTCVPMREHKLCIFNTIERNGVVYNLLDDPINPDGCEYDRRTFIGTRQRQGNRGLLVYPEYTCVPMREHKLCIFNTIERSGVVHNMLDDPINPDGCENVPVPPALEDGLIFHSLNPLGFACEPSFGVSV